MATYYIAIDTDRTAVYGIGTTEQGSIDDALEMCADQCADLTDLEAIPATKRLHDYVEQFGGDVAWIVDEELADLTNKEAWVWARSRQAFTGEFADWLALPKEARSCYVED